MNVAFALQNDYPHVGEVRPRRMARSLVREGHKCSFLAVHSGSRPDSEIVPEGLVVRFSRGLIGPSFPPNPRWILWMARMIRNRHVDILVASNIRAALAAIPAARLCRCPVVLDLQEENETLARHRRRESPFHHLTRSRLVVRLFERWAIRHADHVWVVVRERLEKFPRSVLSRGRYSIVHHTPAISEVRSQGPKPQATDGMALIYIGRFTGGADDIRLIVEALGLAVRSDPNLSLRIGGADENRGELDQLINRCGLRNHAIVEGRIPPDEVGAWLDQGDVGVIAYPINDGTCLTLSNKVFHYMSRGVPVLSTDLKATRRLLQETGGGCIIPRGSSAADVAGTLLELKRSPEARAEMARRGYTAILERYHWEQDFATVLSDLERLTAG